MTDLLQTDLLQATAARASDGAAMTQLPAALRRFVEYAPFPIAAFDRGMTHLAVSTRWLELHGAGRADLVGRRLHEVLPDLPASCRLAHEQVLAGAPSSSAEVQWPQAEGRPRWLCWTAQAWQEDGGAISGVIISIEDIAALKSAQAAVHDNLAQLSAFVNATMDAVISIGENQRIELFNESAARVFGLSAAEAIGQPIERLIPERFSRNHAAHIRSFAATGVTARHMGALGRISGRRANGEEFPAEASISQSAIDGRRIFTVILRDTSERAKAESELKELRHDMERLLTFHVACQTVAAIAHELNQPLNAIASYIEAANLLLSAGNTKPEKLKHALKCSSEQARKAGQILHELFEFLRRGEAQIGAVDLEPSVRRAIAIVDSNGYGEFEAAVDVAPDRRPAWVDRLQVEKVMVNLIRNGVEAMRAAGVNKPRIRIRIGATAMEDMALVTVSDCGPGMDEATAARAFDPFFTTKPRGVGMGLAISRSLVESLGGRLWVETAPGKGSSFHCALPFAP